jgi:hypothetical protein
VCLLIQSVSAGLPRQLMPMYGLGKQNLSTRPIDLLAANTTRQGPCIGEPFCDMPPLVYYM